MKFYGVGEACPACLSIQGTDKKKTTEKKKIKMNKSLRAK